MNKIDIENIVNFEVNSMLLSVDRPYFDKIKLCLISPEKRIFINPISNETEVHWVVFDENQSDKEIGYVIFYSENDETFGIGTKTNLNKTPSIGTFIGVYGSFLDAVNSM